MKLLALTLNSQKISYKYYAVDKVTNLYVKLKPTSVEEPLKANNGELTIPKSKLKTFIPNSRNVNEFGYTIYVLDEAEKPDYGLEKAWRKELKGYAIEQLKEQNQSIKELYNSVRKM